MKNFQLLIQKIPPNVLINTKATMVRQCSMTLVGVGVANFLYFCRHGSFAKLGEHRP